jgi:hypothetical protein
MTELPWQQIKRETMECCDSCKYVKIERYCAGMYEHYCNLDGTYPCNRWSAIYETDPQMKNWHPLHFHTNEDICPSYERNEL